MLDVKRMKVLREVAQQGSFSAAAEALAYTQSAVSQQVATLEREAGVRLVERGRGGVRLTDAGVALVGHADAILCRLADAEAELDAISGMRSGRLRMTAFATAGATIVPQAIARFRERHPGVTLQLTPDEPYDALQRLRAGEADIALTITAPHEPAREADIEATVLLDDPMYLLLPAGHALAKRPRIRLQDLAEEEWLLGSTTRCPDTVILVRACQQAGFEPRIGFHSDDYLAIQGFVAAGCGVSLIPDLALIAVRDDVVVRSLGANPPARRIHAATLADSWASPARTAMLEILQDVAGEFCVGRRALALAS